MAVSTLRFSDIETELLKGSPACSVMDEFIAMTVMANLRRTERRIASFLLRTELPIDEVTLVRMQSGEYYPQWKEAADLLVPRHGFEEQLNHG